MKKLTLLILLTITLTANAQIQADAFVLKYNTDITIKNNKLTRSHFRSILINNKNGEKCGEIEIYSSPLKKVSNIKASISDINGNELRKISSSEFKKHDAIDDQTFYNDMKVQEYAVHFSSYPYVLNYSYDETEEQFMYIDYWMPVILDYIPTTSARLSLNVPLNYPINIRTSRNETVNPDTIDNTLMYKWNLEYEGLSKAEKFGVPLLSMMPYVKIVPLKFMYEEAGSMQSWKTYGNWEYNIINKRQELPLIETFTLDKVLENENDSLQMIKKLYHYLQDHTRYINISENTGGLIPHPASYVCTNKYGDCKALSNYFISLLKYIGVKAVYTSVYADHKIRKPDTSFPSQQFNHVIVCVPQRKDTIWLDCTSKLPFNYLGTFTQGRKVMLTEKDNTHFTSTPALQLQNVENHRDINITVDDDLQASLECNNTFRGEEFEDLAYIINAGKDDKDMFIRNEIFRDEIEVSKYEVAPHHRDSTSIHIKINASSSNVFTRYGNDIVLKTVSLSIPRMEQPDIRKYDVQIDFPIFKTDVQTYFIFDKFKMPTLPETQHIKSKYGEYQSSYKVVNNTLVVTKKFILMPCYVPRKQYQDFYQFISKVDETDRGNCIALSNK